MQTIRFGARRDRRAGDAARDRGDWAGAERHYLAHLRRMPDDAAIWTQLGHVRKELGRMSEALDAYRQATERSPNDPDPWNHYAHLAKDLGKGDVARTAFEHGYALDGTRQGFDRLVALGVTPHETAASRTKPQTFLIIDDLLKFMTAHVTLSGIQRVQVGVIEGLLDRADEDCRFIASNYNHASGEISFWVVPNAAVSELVRYATSGEDMRRSTLDRILERAAATSRRAAFIRDDIVFVPGAFWIVERTGQTCAALKRTGVKIGVYIYDLIPISHPEYCHPELVQIFTIAFTEIVQFSDFITTISVYVADVVSQFLRDHGLPDIPVTPLPLAHFLTIANDRAEPTEAFARKLQTTLKKRPYALYVSTLEGRKNHIYVAHIWRELMRAGVDMPDLVFLGRKGWRSEGLYEYLDGTDNVSKHVHIMHDVSDGDLASLYRGCQFSLFTSFVEGWGLPVGESLVFGRPCVASSACSIPEVGGDLVDYIDPYNMRDGMDVIRRMATDTAYREGRAAAIAERFVPRSWTTVTDGLVAVLRAVRRRPALPVREKRLAPGELYSFGRRDLDLTDFDRLLDYPPYLFLGTDFFNPEAFGAWMKGVRGSIVAKTTLDPGEPVIVALQLAFAPWCREVDIAVSTTRGDGAADGDAQTIKASDQEPVVVTVPAVIDEGGCIRIALALSNYVAHLEDSGREFYIGVRSLTYVRAGDGTVSLAAGFVRQHAF